MSRGQSFLQHCVLPQNIQSSDFHTSCHHAYAQAELTRPFPLGHASPLPPKAPTLQGQDLFTSRSHLAATLYNPTNKSAACSSGERDTSDTIQPLATRLSEALSSACLFPGSLHDTMWFPDVIASFYYRALQISKFIHVCKLGYCRRHWADRASRSE